MVVAVVVLDNSENVDADATNNVGGANMYIHMLIALMQAVNVELQDQTTTMRLRVPI